LDQAHLDTFYLRDPSKQVNENYSQKSKEYLDSIHAANTLDSYESDWKDFYYWCNQHRLNPLPASPENVVNYIAYLADGVKANTIARRLSAISANHTAAGYPDDKNPATDSTVRRTLRSIRRKKGTIQHGKAPLMLEDMHAMVHCFDTSDIAGKRDKALMFTGFAGAFRRSELVGLDADDLLFSREGVQIMIRKSKADQDGGGQKLGLPYSETPLSCPVIALKDWMQAAQITSGPLFRPINRHKQVRDQRLTDKSVANIVKKYAEMIGLDGDDFAGHSLRRGFATSAAQHDVDERSIMKQTRHKSERMVRRYIAEGNIFKDNPLSKMKL
jgi:site-specific recombinase XerD